jgi:hypothetical protein
MIIIIVCIYNSNDLEKYSKDYIVITIEVNLPTLVKNDEYC